MRSRILSGWQGPPARLADSLLALALLVWIAELLGVAGALARLPLITASVAVGLGLRFGLRAPAAAGKPPPAPGGSGQRLAVAVGVLVSAHWLIGVVAALHTGITNYDSTWYHMPFAADFAQSGSTLGFAYVSPRYLAWFYPQNSELLHGVGMVLVRRDVLSPLLNLLLMGGCLLAAWCVGRPYARGAWTLAAAAVLLDAGAMADQAGTARNDTLGVFLLLAAAAVLVNGAAGEPRGRPGLGPLAVAGVAVGLAAGTKLSFVAPAVALLIAVPALAGRGRRLASGLSFGLPVLAGCGFWYLRNIAVAGNPLPWFRALGPLRLDGPEQGLGGRPQSSVLHYLGDGRVWTHWLQPKLVDRLGELWPLLLAAAALGVLYMLVRGGTALRLIAVAAGAGLIAYLVDGTSAEGPPGMPYGFASGLRHLLPALFLGLVLVPLTPVAASRRGRMALGALLAALLLSSDISGARWHPLYLTLALAGAALVLCVPQLRTAAKWRPQPRAAELEFFNDCHSETRVRPRWGLGAVMTASAVLLAGGWLLQRSYLDHRYAGSDFRASGLNAAFAWASTQEGQRIATTLPLQYPLMGTDLSNQVRFLGRRRPDWGFTAIPGCRAWRAALAEGGYGYVLTAGLPRASAPGTASCLAGDPRATPVVRRQRIVLFRIDRRRG